MYSARSLALAAAALATTASASPYLSQLHVPAGTVAPGSTLEVTFDTAIYIQNWEDFGIVWGIRPTSLPVPGQGTGEQVSVGTQVDYTPIYPDHRAESGKPYAATVKIPEGQAKGDWNLVAGIPYLVGASGNTQVRALNATITIA